MSKKVNPADRGENTNKFKPSNVQDEGHGSVASSGRKDRDMEHDMSRGSKPETKQQHRG